MGDAASADAGRQRSLRLAAVGQESPSGVDGLSPELPGRQSGTGRIPGRRRDLLAITGDPGVDTTLAQTAEVEPSTSIRWRSR